MAHSHNRAAWDALVRKQQRFTRPASDEEFTQPLQTVDPAGWLGGDIRGKKVLCLAAGGGRQGPLYAAAGGDVVVVDISPGQLAIDREVAAERGLSLRTVETSMDDLNMFAAGTFDLVIQPVSTCYVPQIGPVYAAVARVIRAGGIYVSQHKSPVSLQTAAEAKNGSFALEQPYYRQGPLPAVVGSRHREEGTLEYLHRWEEILGLMCRAGFAIEDVVEPLHAQADAAQGTFAHRSQFVAPYVRIKARRNASSVSGSSSSLWMPELNS